MPIVNTVLTAAQFSFLQNNITQQYNQVSGIDAIALSGLHYVASLSIDAPEVDLVNPFADQLARVDSLSSTSVFLPVVGALNNHCVNRGTPVSGTIAQRFNVYLTNTG